MVLVLLMSVLVGTLSSSAQSDPSSVRRVWEVWTRRTGQHCFPSVDISVLLIVALKVLTLMELLHIIVNK
jgi:hypothetical protein